LKVKSDEVMFLKEALGKNTSFNTKEELLNIINSKCSVIAATNPRFGRFDRYKSITEQMNIPSTILSCFDLVFVVEDKNSMEEDAKRTHHLLKLHQENKINLEIDYNLLKKYITYAREKVKPKLTDETIEMIQEFYVRIRQLSEDEDPPIPITVRQLESLIKLSEASARIRLSAEVNESDVKRVIGFYERSLKQVGFDPQDVIISSDSHRTNLQGDTEDLEIVIGVLREIENRYDGQAPLELFIDIVSTRHNMGRSDIEEIIKIIKRRGLAYEPQKGFLKLV
jgi:replicative DNA helicase Mcm